MHSRNQNKTQAIKFSMSLSPKHVHDVFDLQLLMFDMCDMLGGLLFCSSVYDFDDGQAPNPSFGP